MLLGDLSLIKELSQQVSSGLRANIIIRTKFYSEICTTTKYTVKMTQLVTPLTRTLNLFELLLICYRTIHISYHIKAFNLSCDLIPISQAYSSCRWTKEDLCVKDQIYETKASLVL